MTTFISAAKYLVGLHGSSVVYSAVTTGAYNIETGTTTNTQVDTTLTAFAKTVKTSSYNYPDLIGKTVLEFIIVATDLASIPKPLDTITRATEVFLVDSVREYNADGAPVIYKVVAYKG